MQRVVCPGDRRPPLRERGGHLDLGRKRAVSRSDVCRSGVAAGIVAAGIIATSIITASIVAAGITAGIIISGIASAGIIAAGIIAAAIIAAGTVGSTIGSAIARREVGPASSNQQSQDEHHHQSARSTQPAAARGCPSRADAVAALPKGAGGGEGGRDGRARSVAVSYTHLTLPTKA